MNELTTLMEIGSGPLSNQLLFGKLKKQVEKDLLFSGINTIKSDSPNPLSFFNSLIGIIQSLMMTDPEKIRALLYRVDVSESLINELTVFENQSEVLSEKITKLLIIRELEKIKNRKKYEKD